MTFPVDPKWLEAHLKSETHGGHGSGNYGHGGRPGERGGSAPGEGEDDKPKGWGHADHVKAMRFDEAVKANDKMLDSLGEGIEGFGDWARVDNHQGDAVLAEIVKGRDEADVRPWLVSRDKMDELVQDDGYIQVFRGETKSEHVEQFKTGDLHEGLGSVGNGIYTAGEESAGLRGEEIAANYAGGNTANCERIGIGPEAKIVDIDSAFVMDRYAHLKELRSKNVVYPTEKHERYKQEALMSICEDNGRYAAFLGYDVMHAPADNYYVLLDRKHIAVEKGVPHI